MTSWQRGDENEDKGERLMESPDITDKVKGAGLKAAGEIEQGLDNVKDKLTGKQDDWQGKERNVGVEAGEWVENRGEDIQRASKEAADETDRTIDRLADDTNRTVDRLADEIT